jgi:Bacteriophage probable baseplate hub protein
MSAALSYPVRTPAWTLTYGGVNITADVTSMVEAIVYENHEQHLADEVQITLEDRDGRWQGPWFPTYGDVVALQVGYAGEPLLPCGAFQVDELELQGPPDAVHLRCIAAGITSALRTPTSARFESQTLAQIAALVANRHGFTVVNAPAANGLVLARVTQRRETDLQFLLRLANAYDYDFSVRGTQLIFYARAALEALPPVLVLRRTDLISFAFKARTNQIYQAARVSYQNPATKTLISQAVSAANDLTGDVLNLAERAESSSDALARAAAALHRHNMLQATMRITLPGTTTMVAGNTVALQGFGQNDGAYLITAARHRLERSTGYTTEAEGRKLS